MPSLRKRVSTYFRQLSFHNEPRQKRNNVNENAFVTKYLEGHISLREGPPIIHGKNPTDLPNYELAKYDTGYESVVSCYSGPHGGLTTIRRVEKHLSIPDADNFDFIDTQEEVVQPTLPKNSPKRTPGQPVDNTKMVIKVAGQEYFVKNDTKKHKKSQSLSSISDFNIEIEKTKIDKEFYSAAKENRESVNGNNNNESRHTNIEVSKEAKVENNNDLNQTKKIVEDKIDDRKESRKNPNKDNKRNRKRDVNKPDKDHVVRYRPPKSTSGQRHESQVTKQNIQTKEIQKNFGIVKSKSEGNPFRHKGTKKTVERPKCVNRANPIPTVVIDDSNLPDEWNKKSDFAFGISDSLYDTNLATKIKNGDPIADCFGVISRQDSMILAVADGVNWGEKACIAAKSAIHGCLHYLNKTIFNDMKLFENLIVFSEQQATSLTGSEPLIHIANTREVFICLLRAFNCAHDLILENNGMLTTLTVAIVLPLSKSGGKMVGEKAGRVRVHDSEVGVKEEDRYVCCVCNVGDTLAYIYSSKYGVRELTKGSHDVNSNRDMRDALGALGPVDGINPELSNLTLSIATLNKGDIVMVASDGLTDNFDPNVCKFTVNTAAKINPIESKGSTKKTLPNYVEKQKASSTHSVPPATVNPVKPPRRNHLKKGEGTNSLDCPDSKKSGDSCSNSKILLINERADSPTKGDASNEKVPESNTEEEVLMDNPLIAHFIKQNSVEEISEMDKESNKKVCDTKPPPVVENKTSSLRQNISNQKRQDVPSTSRGMSQKSQGGKPQLGQRQQQGYSFLRSKTTIDFHSTTKKPILRNEEGIPYVTPLQRYELQLLLIEDILKHGISGQESPCTVSRKLCENLVNFAFSITAAKRRTLEDMDLYFDNRDGVLVEVSPIEKKQRRKKGLEKVLNLPGKLDHVTVVACNVGLVPIKV